MKSIALPNEKDSVYIDNLNNQQKAKQTNNKFYI
jgi:hypothetical protein